MADPVGNSAQVENCIHSHKYKNGNPNMNERLLIVIEKLEELISAEWKGDDLPSILLCIDKGNLILFDSNFALEDLRTKSNCVHEGNLLCVSYRFVKICLFALQKLAAVFFDNKTCSTFDLRCVDTAESDTDLPKNFLSVSQTNQLRLVLRFVVHTGLVKRLYFGPQLCGDLKNVNFQKCFQGQLLAVLRLVLECCQSPHLRDMIFPKYAYEVLGAALQLSYCSEFNSNIPDVDRKFCLTFATSTVFQMMKLSDLTANVILLQGSKRFPSPRWLQGSCGLLLSKALLQDNGFVAVVTAVMENFEAEVNICTRADLVAKIVTRLPQASASKEKYCRNICHQILKLLFCDAMFGKRKDVVIVSLCHAVVATTFSFYVKLTTFCDRFLVTSLFKPFDDCCDNQAKPGSEAGATDGRDGVRVSLTQAVEALHRLVVLYKHNDQDDFVRRRLHSRLHLLFRLYTWTRKTASCHLTALLRDVIVRCLVAFPHKRQAAECLLTLANVKTAAGAGEWKRARATLRFRFQDTEPVAFDLCGAEKLSPEDVIAAQDDVTDSVISIMEAGSGLGFESDCLVVLLETLFDDEEEDDEEEPSRGGRLEPDDERAARFLARGESRLVTVALISHMCDNIPPDQLLGNDAGKTSRFLQVVLESYAKSAISVSDDGDERIRLVFAIVALCLVPADYQTLKPLLPPLQKIATKCASSEIGEIAADLALAIMTTSSPDDLSIFSDFMQKQARVMGTSPSTTSSMTQQTPKMVANKSDPIPDLTLSPDRRKEQQPSSPKFNTDHDNTVNSARGCDSSPVSPPAGAVEQTSDDSFADKCMEEAIDGIYDPSPPIRAAAIRRLRDLVHRRHPPALAGAARLLDVMMTSLRNEQDPFVYLSSVRCVAEIAQVAGAGAARTRSFLDQLVDEFAKSLEREEDNDAVIAKLGEVLVRVVTQLGDTTACASRRLLPVLLSGSAGHRPAHVRTTCVSLLADLLPALRHQVHSMQFEITECLCGIASGERDVEVRRAAVHAIRTIVECLGSDLIQALPDVMRRWYATCKRCYSRDDDNRVQLHAQLALESLDATMRDQLLPDRAPPSKKIVVLPT